MNDNERQEIKDVGTIVMLYSYCICVALGSKDLYEGAFGLIQEESVSIGPRNRLAR